MTKVGSNHSMGCNRRKYRNQGTRTYFAPSNLTVESFLPFTSRFPTVLATGSPRLSPPIPSSKSHVLAQFSQNSALQPRVFLQSSQSAAFFAVTSGLFEAVTFSHCLLSATVSQQWCPTFAVAFISNTETPSVYTWLSLELPSIM